MTVSELMQAMSDAGAPMAAIIIAVRAIEEKEAALEARRAVERERKQRQRDRVRDSHGTVTGQSADIPAETPSLEVSPQTPLPNPTPTRNETPRARKAEPFPRPEWADPEVWADLLTNRRKKNLPNTASAHRKLLADIDKLTDAAWPPGRVLEAAVSRGWGAIYAGCKDDDDGRTNGNANRGGGGRLGGPGPDPTLALVRAATAAQREDAGDHWQTWAALPAR